jgi:aminoglycoside phosphotransferase family enzyme/predicted kinase
MPATSEESAQDLLPKHLWGLLSPRAYPHPVGSVELVQTHVSWVLLTGPYAYKIKRPVHYDFVDLRSARHRAFLCREELRLNRRFAPDLYLEVCDVTSEDGDARISGPGMTIEHAVRMRQFDREDELDRMLAAGRIGPPALEAFGRHLAGIHEGLPVAPTDAPWGRAAQVRSIVLDNLEQCLRAMAAHGDPERLDFLRQELPERLERLAPLLEQRRAAGRVRECHGDLHARNVVFRGGELLAFDCLEFSEAFRWIDVADEVAFLVADLEARGCREHAHAFLGGWTAGSGDFAAYRVLSLYQAHRALVRAKVAALGEAGPSHRELESNLAVARAALVLRKPFVVLLTGLSGSGKTWLASRLAPRLGAVHLRSDVERKRLAGLTETARTDSPVQRGLYAPGTSARVYEHLAACAEAVLGGGYPVIVDAAFGRRDDRARFLALADRLGLPLRLLDCRASPEVLRERITRRRALATDASEAGLEVLQWQQKHHEPVALEEGLATLEVDTSKDDPQPSLDELVARLRAAP